jgi:hypothetical protein
MKGNFRNTLVLMMIAAGIASSAAPAHAQPILQARCAADSLDPATAKLRLEWARACGTRINLVSPTSPRFPASKYGTNNFSGGIELIEYLELAPDDGSGRNSFSGDTADVNQTFVQSQWRASAYSVTNDALGFQRWIGSIVLPRPLYPTFGNDSDINSAIQLFPNPSYNPNDCNLYTDAAGTHVYNSSGTGFYVNGFCTSSCYLPGERISFEGGTEGILDAMNQLRTGVTTLTPKSTLGKIQTRTDDVASYTHDLRDATQVIFTIKTRSGGELRVTDKHPVLEGNGRIVQASSLKAGNHLLKADGTRDEVVSVTRSDYFGKVYNLKPVSTNRVANILIAQGFLVGSSRFQNDDVDFINRIILTHGIPGDVIPR